MLRGHTFATASKFLTDTNFSLLLGLFEVVDSASAADKAATVRCQFFKALSTTSAAASGSSRRRSRGGWGGGSGSSSGGSPSTATNDEDSN